MGEMLLESGAEISRVEDTIVRMGQAYGAVRTEVFVITSIISLTMEFGDGYVATETRRSVNEVNTDFRRIESINAISRECCMDSMTVSKLRKRVDQAAEGSKSYTAILTGSVLAASSFAMFFGGAAGIFTAILPSLHLDKILIGDIMLLIPGIPMTNSIRNMLVGDTISGIVRLAESLMWAVAIAGGIMVALVVISYIQ